MKIQKYTAYCAGEFISKEGGELVMRSARFSSICYFNTEEEAKKAALKMGKYGYEISDFDIDMAVLTV